MNTQNSPFTILAFGDSITFGAKATGYENSWLGVFEQQLRLFLANDFVVINRSVGDNVVSPASTNYEISIKPSAMERVQKDVIELKPDFVFVCFGLNDMRFGTPTNVFVNELDTLITKMKTSLPATRMMLTNVFHMTGFDMYEPRDKGSREKAREYNEAIADLASRLSLPIADTAEAMAENDFLIHDDGVHGNDLGHRIIGNRVFEAFVADMTHAARRQNEDHKLAFKKFIRDERYCL